MVRELDTDVVVLGGGTGGFAAALAAARMGKNVVVVEETDWIGGQLTSQAVPPDEHPWIEKFGCTLGYRRFRDGVRRCFRDHFPLRGETRVAPMFQLGGALVSRVPCPPEIAVKVLQQLLLPYRMNGRIIVLMESKPVAAEVEGDRVSCVTVEELESGRRTVLTGSYFLDATELGDVLPLTGTEYVTGAESREETGEPHAPPGLEMAERHVGAETLNYEKTDVDAELRERTGGRGPDVCIEAIGLEAHTPGPQYRYEQLKQQTRILETDRPHAIRQAIIACRKGGTVFALGVFVGLVDKFPMGALMNKGLTLRGAQQHGERYIPMLLERMAAGELETAHLMTHPMPLDEGPRGYDLFKNKKDGCVRAVFQP
jgi:hypothetical protein